MNLRVYEFVDSSTQKSKYTYLELDVLSYSDDIIENILTNIFNIKIKATCHYITDEQFRSYVKCESGFSIIHVNCRSPNANMCHLENVLHYHDIKFDIIAISESWLHSESNLTLLEISDYDFCHVDGKGKKCGGVALYVNNVHDYKVSDNLSFIIADNTEFLTIELKTYKLKT